MDAPRGKLVTVYGGQFGSEGKGEIVASLMLNGSFDIGVRVGGPNAGHTFMHSTGKKMVVQSLPIVATEIGNTGVIGAAGMLIPDLLEAELKAVWDHTGWAVKLLVDDLAAVITPELMEAETELKGRIGSTGEGVGAATAAKVWRKPEIVAKHESHDAWFEQLAEQPWGRNVRRIADTAGWVNTLMREGKNVLIEGTQGAGLSLHTSGFYPYCTSRECTPTGLLAETGINPKNAAIYTSVMVCRTFPIRVGGNSGPMYGELTWEELSRRTHGYIQPEITTVTKKQRRIAEQDWQLLEDVTLRTGPDVLAVTFLDYVFPELADKAADETLPAKAVEYLERYESVTGVPVAYVAWGRGKSRPYFEGSCWKDA